MVLNVRYMCYTAISPAVVDCKWRIQMHVSKVLVQMMFSVWVFGVYISLHVVKIYT